MNVALGSHWRSGLAAHVALDVLIDVATGPRLQTCPTCGAGWVGDDAWCEWCAIARRAQADFVLKPPAPRGYGHATDDDLTALGYDRVADRQRDLERWARDLDMAAETGLITTEEAKRAWDSQKN